MPETIYFYSWTKDYFEFSNFSKHSITIDGKTYATNEHYFQSMKFLDPEYQETIRLAPTPREAKKLGLSRQYAIHSDWDQRRRFIVMRSCLEAKFSQHPALMKMLISTNDAILVEDSPKDTFWGIGKNRNGQNMLGKMLMELRNQLQSASSI